MWGSGFRVPFWGVSPSYTDELYTGVDIGVFPFVEPAVFGIYRVHRVRALQGCICMEPLGKSWVLHLRHLCCLGTPRNLLGSFPK